MAFSSPVRLRALPGRPGTTYSAHALLLLCLGGARGVGVAPPPSSSRCRPADRLGHLPTHSSPSAPMGGLGLPLGQPPFPLTPPSSGWWPTRGWLLSGARRARHFVDWPGERRRHPRRRDGVVSLANHPEGSTIPEEPMRGPRILRSCREAGAPDPGAAPLCPAYPGSVSPFRFPARGHRLAWNPLDQRAPHRKRARDSGVARRCRSWA